MGSAASKVPSSAALTNGMYVDHYKNTYKPRAPEPYADVHEHDSPQEYDHNFEFEVKVLRSDRVALVPFTPSVHGKTIFDALKAEPELSRWIPLVITDYPAFLQFIEWNRSKPDSQLFAIYTDSTDPDAPPSDPSGWKMAGIVGFGDASFSAQTAEIIAIIIKPEFQRTHVSTHATGILMKRILDRPENGGLGLRKCNWKAHVGNERSIHTAKRMGFTGEGVTRADFVLAPGKEGTTRMSPEVSRPRSSSRSAGRPGLPLSNRESRDSWKASVVWQEWEGGVAQLVEREMARRS